MEIERKFLVKSFPFDLEDFPSHDILQCYISTDPVIRIRKSDNTYFLTVKGEGAFQREEFEIEIKKESFDKLYEKKEGHVIQKKRYDIPLKKGDIAQCDVYCGPLKGLITAEVEFPTVKKAKKFTPPCWFDKEVTMDNRYKNSSLSIKGLPTK